MANNPFLQTVFPKNYQNDFSFLNFAQLKFSVTTESQRSSSLISTLCKQRPDINATPEDVEKKEKRKHFECDALKRN